MEIESHPVKGVFRLRSAMPKGTAAFPLGLGEVGLHEVAETRFGDMPALTGFVLAAMGQGQRGAGLWVSQHRLTGEHGALQQAGFTAWRGANSGNLLVRPSKVSDALWVVEEAVRSSAVSFVVAEIEAADFTATRRLALAAGRYGVPVVLLMPYTREGATAAAARWRVSPRTSAPNRFDPRALGRPRWQAILERTRQAPHMVGRVFDIEFDDETLSMHVVPGLVAGSPAPRTPQDEDGFGARYGRERSAG